MDFEPLRRTDANGPSVVGDAHESAHWVDDALNDPTFTIMPWLWCGPS